LHRAYSDDLFESTKMSFGEHLEELRGCLWKSVLALTFGFVVGLFLANDFVIYLKVPLEAALIDFYQNKAVVDFRSDLEKKGITGAELDKAAAEFEGSGLICDQVLVDAGELRRQLGLDPPSEKPDPNASGAGFDFKNLVPLNIFRPGADDPRVRVVGFSVDEAFMIWIKAALVIGAVLASPFIFYFIWSFVAAGLFPHEKRYVHLFLPASIGLFLLGATVAFYFAFKFVLDFLFGVYQNMELDPDPRISYWLGFVLLLPIGFGVAFQLPLVMLFLERIRLTSVAMYTSYWRHAVVVISIIAMVLTPADPYSMMLMFVPLVVLYFGGIMLCKYLPRGSES
jgi:sec-independent protein translocase protein TatC